MPGVLEVFVDLLGSGRFHVADAKLRSADGLAVDVQDPSFDRVRC
jgi:hypothetical protein